MRSEAELPELEPETPLNAGTTASALTFALQGRPQNFRTFALN